MRGEYFEKIIRGCKNQAWDISYLSSINNFQYHFSDKEIFFATNDKNLKLIFMGCHYFDNSWAGLIFDRIAIQKDRNEIFDLIEKKMSNRTDIDFNEEYLMNLSHSLEEKLKKAIIDTN